MRILKSLGAVVCALATLAVLATATPARAEEPHYLQALTDLRTARDYLQYDTGVYASERHRAIDEINKAIEEIKHAAWDDGKNTKFSGPGNAPNGWAPLHYGLNALIAARHDVSVGVESPQNTGLRGRAELHIGAALDIVSSLLHAGAA